MIQVIQTPGVTLIRPDGIVLKLLLGVKRHPLKKRRWGRRLWGRRRWFALRARLTIIGDKLLAWWRRFRGYCLTPTFRIRSLRAFL